MGVTSLTRMMTPRCSRHSPSLQQGGQGPLGQGGEPLTQLVTARLVLTWIGADLRGENLVYLHFVGPGILCEDRSLAEVAPVSEIRLW
jgi:hypothetical protein